MSVITIKLLHTRPRFIFSFFEHWACWTSSAKVLYLCIWKQKKCNQNKIHNSSLQFSTQSCFNFLTNCIHQLYISQLQFKPYTSLTKWTLTSVTQHNIASILPTHQMDNNSNLAVKFAITVIIIKSCIRFLLNSVKSHQLLHMWHHPASQTTHLWHVHPCQRRHGSHKKMSRVANWFTVFMSFSFPTINFQQDDMLTWCVCLRSKQ